MWNGASIVLVVVMAAAALAQGDRHGVVTHEGAKAMAGTATYDAEVMSLGRGDVVKVVGRDGDWYAVIVAGGIEAFVKAGMSGRKYVEVLESGEGRVVVDRLQLRPKPTTDWPSMGVLAPNTRIVILKEEADGWYRVLAPAGHAVWVYADYIDVPTMQEGLAEKFAAADAKRREALFESSPMARRGLEARRQAEDLERRFAELDARLEKALAARSGAAELRDIRMKFERLAKFAPPGSEMSHRARDRAAYVRGREGLATDIDDAEARIRNLERDLAKTEERYSDELSKYRAERGEKPVSETGEGAGDLPEAGGRFLRYGIGRVHKDLVASTTGVDQFVLSKGSEERYRMISHRYDLAEYYGKRIGIVKWRELQAGDRGELPRIEVIRLEIVE